MSNGALMSLMVSPAVAMSFISMSWAVLRATSFPESFFISTGASTTKAFSKQVTVIFCETTRWFFSMLLSLFDSLMISSFELMVSINTGHTALLFIGRRSWAVISNWSPMMKILLFVVNVKVLSLAWASVDSKRHTMKITFLIRHHVF